MINLQLSSEQTKEALAKSITQLAETTLHWLQGTQSRTESVDALSVFFGSADFRAVAQAILSLRERVAGFEEFEKVYLTSHAREFAEAFKRDGK